MLNSLLIVVVFALFGGIGAFFIPGPSQMSGFNNLSSHLQWAIAIAQGFIFICAGFFTLQATFRIKTLGGIIGNSLKYISLGLFFFGLAFIQIPIVAILDLWTSAYFTKNIYWVLYLIALILTSIGLFSAVKSYTKKAYFYSILIVILFVMIRFILFSVPFSPVLYKTPSQFEMGLTIASILNVIAGILLLLSFLLKNTFNNSKIGEIFRLFVFAFVFLFIGAILGYPIIILTGTQTWWYTYGLYYSLFLDASIFFLLFSLKLKYFKI